MSGWLKATTDGIAGVIGRIVDVICPDVCTVCGRRLVDGEEVMCLDCLVNLPVTDIHHPGFTQLHERVVSTRYIVDKAAALMWYFRESDYARLLHDAKYNHRPRVAKVLGGMFGRRLEGYDFFSDIDLLLPVPLHFTKLISRGYNQARVIAEAISAVTGIAVADNIECKRIHGSQTRMGIAARYANAREAYSIVRPEELDGKHILIIDDVITTGATMRACLELISSQCFNVRLSILALAAARIQ